MRYVAIIKTVGELAERRADQANLPEQYPVDCVEFEAASAEDAQAAHPGRQVMSVDEYKGYSVALSDLYEQAQAEASVPWWKFWG